VVKRLSFSLVWTSARIALGARFSARLAAAGISTFPCSARGRASRNGVRRQSVKRSFQNASGGPLGDSAPMPAGQRYGGRTADERRAERRERLLDAGLELFGTQGYANTSIEALCSATRLNPRYFYESLKTREELLRAVYDRHTRLATAVGVSLELERHRRDVLRGFAELVEREADALAAQGLLPARDHRPTALAIVDTLVDLFLAAFLTPPQP